MPQAAEAYSSSVEEKTFGILSRSQGCRFRLKDSNYEKVILTTCGLVRLRIGAFLLV